jgi:WW domain-binding protein 11
MEAEYESKRNQMIKFYESVKSAQEVTIDDIPLPSVPMEPSAPNSAINASLPLSEQTLPQSILKRHNLSSQVSHKTPPGCPPGPPPILSDIEDDCDDDYDSDNDKDKSKKIRFSDETKTNDKDSDINEFLKEIDQMEKSVNIKESLSQTVQSIQSLPAIGSHQSSTSTHSAIPPPPSLRASNVPSGPPPPSLIMFRPPGPPQSGIRSASQGLLVPRPGMPSGMTGPPPPTGMRPGLPPHRMSVPLSGAPRMMSGMRPMPPQHQQSNTFTAPPTLSKREDKKTHFISDRATIEAKPQLRNLSADATRFTPVALRVKREDKVVKKSVPKLGINYNFFIFFLTHLIIFHFIFKVLTLSLKDIRIQHKNLH